MAAGAGKVGGGRRGGPGAGAGAGVPEAGPGWSHARRPATGRPVQAAGVALERPAGALKRWQGGTIRSHKAICSLTGAAAMLRVGAADTCYWLAP